MWPFNDAVNEWFEDRKDNKPSTEDDREVVPMVKNEDPRLMKMRAMKSA
jgi:hypothetical protein